MIEGLKPTSILLDEKELNSAQDTLATNQLPTTRMEAWKYTRVAKLGKTNYSTTEENITSLDSYRIAEDATTFVFVNGHFSEELSSDEIPTGVSISPLSSCMEGEIQSTNLVLEGELTSKQSLTQETSQRQMLFKVSLLKTLIKDLRISLLRFSLERMLS